MLFEGKDIAGAKPPRVVASGIAHCPEGRRVFPHMTVEENLDMGAYLRTGAAEISADRERIYAEFPRLADRKKQAAGTLSGGEQQMLAIGRALMSRPRLLCSMSLPLDGAQHRRADFCYYPRYPRRRHDRSAGRTERVRSAGDVRPCLPAGRWPYRSVRAWCRDDRKRARAEGLSWRMSGPKWSRCQATENGCRSAAQPADFANDRLRPRDRRRFDSGLEQGPPGGLRTHVSARTG